MDYWGRPKVDHVKALIHPVDGYRGELEAKGIKPKDHHKLNHTVIKTIEQQNLKLKVHEEIEKTKEPFKMTWFLKVDPKIKS